MGDDVHYQTVPGQTAPAFAKVFSTHALRCTAS